MISAIFSASVAIVLFVLTQFWTWARSRSDRLKQKHEDLIAALYGILHVIQPIPDHLPSAERASASLARSFEILNATSRPLVLIQLYFKDVEPRFFELQHSLTPIIARFREGLLDPDKAGLTLAEVKAVTKATINLTDYLLENAGPLTREPVHWLRPSSW